ncbi:hepatocyte growth factor activator [Pelobates cultripes]|uniref:Hepatocyte growth factor activator n=1 Tax=Pelobates cultripes TaxID=61616 RepID=A0AAD1W8I3_PELCU|nr:hepatocyte growth factor activator [Pelobates cultripes]
MGATVLLTACALLFHFGQTYGAVNRGRPMNPRLHGMSTDDHQRTVGFRRPVLTQDGKECKFPFRRAGRLYYSCIAESSSTRTWCATTHNYDRDKERGYCLPSYVKGVSNLCIPNPCENGGVCIDVLAGASYHCACPEGFMGTNCNLRKCFDDAHYEFYDHGDTWGRIHKGRVEKCSCQDGAITCHTGERYKACNENPCLNGGACRFMQSTGQAVCGCKPNYVGKYCNIDVSHRCYDNGIEYRGTVKKTLSNQTCLKWNSEYFVYESHIGNILNYAIKGLGSHPYCRVPDDDEDSPPWCYTLKHNSIIWEACDVSSCYDKAKRIVTLAEDVAKPKCGKKHEKRVYPRGRVVGGTAAMPASHPWMAAIYIGQSFCSGTLIHPCWVVSAAHCFAHSPLKTMIKVVLGQHFFNETTDDTQAFQIDRYIFHDDYSAFKPTDHDIVLIRLKKVNNICARKTQFVQPICLPDPSITFEDGYACDIAGWGRMSEDSTDYSHVLQEVSIPLVPDSKCSSPEVYGFEVSENMFCAGYFECYKDACQGDSGGGLTCERDKISYLYGIISWGDGCGRTNKPGVYTRVSNYVDWIKQKTNTKK